MKQLYMYKRPSFYTNGFFDLEKSKMNIKALSEMKNIPNFDQKTLRNQEPLSIASSIPQE